MRRQGPIRSLMVGDCDHYVSPYMRGVAQGMEILGHDHRQVSIRRPIAEIRDCLLSFNPTIVWTHMLLWPPPGCAVARLVELMLLASRLGADVVIHDGDAKEGIRYPRDISQWCSLALVNHGYDRSAWGVKTLRWPYFAMHQDQIAEPDERYRCDLWFAGRMSHEPLYAARTRLVEQVQALGVSVLTPTEQDGNTLDKTPTIAASAGAVLGFGRPEVKGWVDTRVFQYISAGGILLHDDVGGYFDPWVHYVPYVSGSAESVVDAIGRLRCMSEEDRMAIRLRGFERGQERHSSVVRCRQVLTALGVL